MEISVIALKKFQFRLQTVLDIRSEQSNRVQLKLAIEEKKRRDFLDKIDTINQQLEQGRTDYESALMQGEFDASRIQAFTAYLNVLKQQRHQQEQLLAKQEKVIAIVREELRQAMVRQKSLELLKDKHHKAYRKTVENEEEKFLAEVSLNRFYQQQQDKLAHQHQQAQSA